MVSPGIGQRGEEKHVTEGGQQINKPKSKLVENMSKPVLRAQSSGECVSACISTTNRLKGVYVCECLNEARSNTSPPQRGSLISPRKILRKETGMI